MQLTPQDVSSLKDNSNWNGFSYAGEEGENQLAAASVADEK